MYWLFNINQRKGKTQVFMNKKLRSYEIIKFLLKIKSKYRLKYFSLIIKLFNNCNYYYNDNLSYNYK